MPIRHVLCQGPRLMQDVHCQVLVIGGGAAAMRAAIAAHDAGASTLIVSKQTPGYSGNSVIARSGHSAPFGAPGINDTRPGAPACLRAARCAGARCTRPV